MTLQSHQTLCCVCVMLEVANVCVCVCQSCCINNHFQPLDALLKLVFQENTSAGWKKTEFFHLVTVTTSHFNQWWLRNKRKHMCTTCFLPKKKKKIHRKTAESRMAGVGFDEAFSWRTCNRANQLCFTQTKTKINWLARIKNFPEEPQSQSQKPPNPHLIRS